MLLKEYKSIVKTENGYIIHADAADLMLVFLKEDVIRIRVSFDRTFPEASYALVTTAWEDRLDPLFAGERKRITALDVPYEDGKNKLVFHTGTLRLVMRKCPLSFVLYDEETGEQLYADLRERAFEKDQLGRVSHYSLMDRAKDHFYGFGEKTGYLDKKGRRLRMSPKDAIGHDPEFGDPMYKHIPFYIRLNEDAPHPVGLFYNNSYDCVFDMGQEISGYWDRYCYYQADSGDIDLFLMTGKTIRDVVEHYTWLTGRTVLPTKQSLGYCASTMYYAELEKDCDQEIYRVIDKHEKEDIPIDNFWLASGYSSGEEDNLRYTFNWNHKRFPNPKEFFDTMSARGVNVICNLKPGVLKNHPYADFYEKRNAFIKTPDGKNDYYGRWWGGEGRFIDFTGKAGRDAWKELLDKTILSMGEKTVWNDNCEMDGVEDRSAYCDFEGQGGTMAELKIIHSNMMAWLGRKALLEKWKGERPYVINRAGFAGIQRYAQVWGGDNLTDWRTVKFNIDTILGMGLSGCANMGCDIGGFTGPAPTEEMLLRWIQTAIFQPRFVINSANTDNTVTQPWMYEEDLPYIRRAFHLRYQMLPYLYSLMREASVDGSPVMRPLFYEFPQDKALYSDRHMEFMFGPSVLVANVVEEGAKTREVYLPAGALWYDMADNMKQYEGGQTIVIPVDKDSIPMFLRGSGIFMTTGDIKKITKDTMRHLDILIGAQEDASFDFYDDDGHTMQYEDGVYALTKIEVTSGERTKIRFRKSGSFSSTVQQIQLRVVSKEKGAYWCDVCGRRLPRFIVKDDFEKAREGWFYNMPDRTVLVKFDRPQQDDFEVTVSTEKFDLVGMVLPEE